jgi:acetyl esterase/lipase
VNTAVTHEALTYAQIQGYRPLLLDLHLPAGASADAPVPIVIWLHGGAFWSGDRRHLPGNLAPNAVFDTLTAAGIACATIDYRLSGESHYPAQLHDVRAAIDYLHDNATRWGLDTTRIGTWGESSGGTLGALAALAPAGDHGLPVSAVALWSSPTDLVSLRHFSAIYLLLSGNDGTDTTNVPGQDLEAAAAQASPLTHVRHDAPPFLIQHATDDATVSFEQGQILHEALLAAGARSTLVAVPNGGHVFKNHPDPQQLVEEAVAFFVKELLEP